KTRSRRRSTTTTPPRRWCRSCCLSRSACICGSIQLARLLKSERLIRPGAAAAAAWIPAPPAPPAARVTAVSAIEPLLAALLELVEQLRPLLLGEHHPLRREHLRLTIEQRVAD